MKKDLIDYIIEEEHVLFAKLISQIYKCDGFIQDEEGIVLRLLQNIIDKEKGIS